MKSHKLSAAVIGGCLGFLSYPAINWTPLVAVAYIPYFWLLNRCERFKEAVFYTWLFSAVMTLGGFFWIAYTAVEFGNLPWLAAIPILLLYASVGSINLAVAGAAVVLLRKRISMRWQVLWVTGTFIVIEAFFPKLFFWYAGNAIYQITPLIQIADLGGAILLTTQIFWVNYALFAIVDQFILPRFRKLAPIFTRQEAFVTIGLGAGILSFSLIYGHFRLQQVERQQQAAVQKNVGVVQGNIGNFDRLLAQFGHRETFQKVVETHRDLTLNLHRNQTEKLDFVVWPEGAYPYPFPEPWPEHQMLAELTQETGAALITGGNTRQREPRQYFNAMVLVEPGQATASAIYKKHILLAFGEYMPLSNLFPALKNLIPAISDFGAGPGPEIMSYRELKAAAVICYEALDPHYVRAYAQQGANLIVNVTNDSWFGRWQEPEQHLALSQLRCVESRKAQVRSTNTGVSAVIWPTGEITHRTRLHEPAYFAARVPLMEMPPTFYTRFGDWWAYLMLAVVLVFVVIGGRQFARMLPHTRSGPAVKSETQTVRSKS